MELKGGKCYKVENPRISTSSSGNSSSSATLKDNNNNNSKTKTVKKDKELEELIDLVGNSRSGFVVIYL